jgi:dienelactone hydrolase
MYNDHDQGVITVFHEIEGHWDADLEIASSCRWMSAKGYMF